MSDIVERLRCLPSGWLEHLQAENTVLEAADEIERLREAIGFTQGLAESYLQRSVERGTEIDHLRGLLAEIGEQHRKLAGLVRGAQVPVGTNETLDTIERCVREALGEQ